MKSNVYKVIVRRRSDGLLVSFNMNVLESDACVQYFPEKETFPKITNSFLYAFKTLNDAKEFWFKHKEYCNIDVEIWEGEGEIVDREPVIGYGIWDKDYGIWDKDYKYIQPAPFGTVWIKSFVPITKICEDKGKI